jgi:hypothetical protein
VGELVLVVSDELIARFCCATPRRRLTQRAA